MQRPNGMRRSCVNGSRLGELAALDPGDEAARRSRVTLDDLTTKVSNVCDEFSFYEGAFSGIYLAAC